MSASDNDEQPSGTLVPTLERATYRAEAPLRRLVGSHRLNPLPHAGTISVFLLIVVIATGVYITLFFSYGFEASYRSVQRMHDHPIQNVVRSLHRYSSAALVLTTVVHAWRIFVAGRFRGPRRWRWTTGVAALATVWLAGVSGYWLVWDRRAQALTEATTRLLDGVGWANEIAVRDIHAATAGDGTGWGIMFLIWTAHLLLSALIGWFVWRHVRRSRLRVLPPRHWMAAMGAALVVVALVLPAELLGPADPSRLVDDMPLDPFVMFLLPPLLGGSGWWVLLVAAVVVVAVASTPHVAAAPTPVVAIDEERCTGCELCVVDCPYLALAMRERSGSDGDAGTQPRRPIAVVDADACVGCGICLGSCSFGAMALPGFDPPEAIDPAGRRVVIACQRHRAGVEAVMQQATGGPGEADLVVVTVACSGMVHAQSVGALLQRGATGVQVVGCPPGDCAYGLGNNLLAERLAGTRAPHAAARWQGAAAQDWVAPTDLAAAVSHPAEHPAVDADHPPTGRRLIPAVAVVLASVGVVGAATRAPFRADADVAEVRVVVDHVPGRQLEGQPAATGEPGDTVTVVVRAAGAEVARRDVPVSGIAAVGVVDVEVSPGAVAIEVDLVEGASTTELYRGDEPLERGRRLVVAALDVPPPPGVAEGREVFEDSGRGGCGVCHSRRPGDDRVGPSLAGVADRAATRVPGSTAREYLRQSVLDPDAFVVDGFRAGQMLPIYDERLSDTDVDALVEYLLSLTEGAG